MQESVLGTYNVIISVLRVFFGTIDEVLESKPSTFNKKHEETLTFIKTGASYLLIIFENIKASRNINIIALQIQGLAINLELAIATNVCSENIIKSHYPQLEFIHREFRAGNTNCIETVRETLDSIERCQHVHLHMRNICDQLESIIQRDTDDDIEEETTVQPATPYDSEFYSCADGVFRAIEGECGKHDELEIRLRLGTFPSQTRVQSHRSINILLQCKNNEEDIKFWLSICIHSLLIPPALKNALQTQGSCMGAPQSWVTFDTSVEDECHWIRDDPISRDCLCWYTKETTSEFKSYLQHLGLDGEGWQQHECECCLEDDSHPTEEYTLPALFSQMSWTAVETTVLAMQLSHALAYFYGSNWFIGRWRKANIRFFKWGQQIPCKPWLEVSVPPKSAMEDPKCSQHLFPQILELGVVLLELNIGRSLESYLDAKTPKSLDGWWALAKKALRKFKFLSPYYRRAVEFCLTPKFGPIKSRDALKRPDVIREFIYKEVVSRLERDVRRSGLKTKELEGLDLGSARQKSPIELNNICKPPERNNAKNNEVVATIDGARVKAEPIRMLQDTIQNELGEDLEEGFDLFGDEKGLEACTNSEDSRLWLKKFRETIKGRIGFPSNTQPPSDRRVKVAVLDTGIDLSHSHFDDEYKTGRIRNIASFIDGKNGDEDKDSGDDCGHGTFIASLLLTYGIHIDLYVAKVSKSRAFKQGTVKNIENALYYARNVWEVDIITMSFGFPHPVRGIREEIRLATQKDILVFAAASNDGLNQPRMYPASEDLVFAIHSTCSNGRASRFNPPEKRDENFSILGEYIESAWLTKNNTSGSTRILSGTSFATPLAVCLAAFMICYVPTILPNSESLFHKVKSYAGMRNIFQEMVPQPFDKYQYISLARFVQKYNEAGMINTLERALSK